MSVAEIETQIEDKRRVGDCCHLDERQGFPTKEDLNIVDLVRYPLENTKDRRKGSNRCNIAHSAEVRKITEGQ